MPEPKVLLEINNVSKNYYVSARGKFGFGTRKIVRALDGVSLTVNEGEVVALVGESGSGKSTLARLILALEQPSSGTISIDGIMLSKKIPKADRRKLLQAQMIFQNPVASLNPRQRTREIISEPARVHRFMTGENNLYVSELMERVGLDLNLSDRLPDQMSGGQCQRVGIARALSVKPRLLVCDEPVSALDVSIQAQVLNLFADLREQSNYSYLFISHDLPVVELLSDRIAIMYLGRIVEIASTQDILNSPAHPYTKALLESVLRLGEKKRKFHPIAGEIPSPIAPPTGCHFHPRCDQAMAICRTIKPTFHEYAPGRQVACHLKNEPVIASVPTHAGLNNSKELSV